MPFSVPRFAFVDIVKLKKRARWKSDPKGHSYHLFDVMKCPHWISGSRYDHGCKTCIPVSNAYMAWSGLSHGLGRWIMLTEYDKEGQATGIILTIMPVWNQVSHEVLRQNMNLNLGNFIGQGHRNMKQETETVDCK